MPIKFKGISTVDGRTVEVEGFDTLIPSLLLKYNYSSSSNPPPNTSQLRTDAVDALDTTKIWIHHIDNDNRDVKYFLMQLKIGKRIYIQDVNDADSHALFTLLEKPIDEGNYSTFNVECYGTSGVPIQGTEILLGLFA